VKGSCENGNEASYSIISGKFLSGCTSGELSSSDHFHIVRVVLVGRQLLS
jgi:hypothetical protein